MYGALPMVLSLSLSLAVLAAAPGATLPVERVAIAEVWAPDTLMALAGQVTRELQAEAERQKFTVVGPDELRKALGAKHYDELRKCGSSAPCVAQALDGQGFTRAVVGRFDRDERNYLLKLYFVDVKGLSVIADVDRSILIAARRFQKDLDEAIPRMLRGEKEARGTVTIESNIADAQISLNGEFVGNPGIKLTLKPGKYEVKIERKKYLPVTRLVGVEANVDAVETIQLLLKPGEFADIPKVASGSKQTDSSGPSAGVHFRPATWVVGAVSLVTAGLGLYFGLTARSQDQALLDGFKEATSVYAGTRKDALAAQQNALLANISFGVAGAALVTTVILAILDGVSQPAVTVAPTVSPSGAGLTFGGQF